MPFVRRTRATFRRAEFGFFGVCVITRVQTPRFWGAPRRAGVLVFDFGATRPLRTSWLTVGTELLRRVYATKLGGGIAQPKPSRIVASRRPLRRLSGLRAEGPGD